MATKPAFAQGAQVEHQKFGLGSVVSCNDEYIVIKFDEHGEKKFISSMAIPNLKKSDRQPPVEKRATHARKKAAPAPAPAATTNAVES
jgi:transcription elongation factor GreA-like protein